MGKEHIWKIPVKAITYQKLDTEMFGWIFSQEHVSKVHINNSESV